MKTTVTASDNIPDFDFLGELTPDDKVFVNRVLDIARYAEDKFTPRFSHFLDLRQQNIARQVLLSEKVKNFLFFGGYDKAERVALGVFPEYLEPDTAEFPVKAVTFTYRKEDKLTHRDFLGALMALDIKRETVGDIAVGDGIAVIFLQENMLYTVTSEISKIGRVGVKISEGFDKDKLPKQSFTELNIIVSSLRADCIVSAAIKLSREKTSDLIKRSGIVIDGKTVFTPSANMHEGQVFSVRGFGKFKFVNICGFTRKNRVTVKLYRYD